MGLHNRLARLEEQGTSGVRMAPGWTPEKMVEKAVDDLDFAAATNSPVYLSPYECKLLGFEDPRELPEPFCDIVNVTDHPTGYGFIAHRYKNPPEEPFEGWREKVRKHGERVQAFSEESRRRGAELIARNRNASGLPPLESGR